MPRNFVFFVFLFAVAAAYSQEISRQYNMVATFGNMAGEECIDDDFSQVIFCALPVSYTGEMYIRIFDPDCGGALDRPNGLWETNTIFTIYGGQGCISEKDARGTAPSGNYTSGRLLQQEIFAKESEVDGKWFDFGPFNVKDGEQLDAFPGYVFLKIVVEGRTGDDGNVYGLFLSQSAHQNREIAHSVFFGYEQIVVTGNYLAVKRADTTLLKTEEIRLPVQLDPLQPEPDFNIIAEPIDE